MPALVSESGKLPGIRLLKPVVFEDPRGFFTELYHQEKYRSAGLTAAFVQDNCSHSSQGVLRGLHYQLQYPQGKLVTVLAGAVFDVAVDIRRGSPTFGQWEAHVLSGDNHHQLYIPAGFAHGFAVLSESATVLYKCTGLYHPGDDRGIIWNDPGLGIDWPDNTPLLSAKDAALPALHTVPEAALPVMH